MSSGKGHRRQRLYDETENGVFTSEEHREFAPPDPGIELPTVETTRVELGPTPRGRNDAPNEDEESRTSAEHGNRHIRLPPASRAAPSSSRIDSEYQMPAQDTRKSQLLRGTKRPHDQSELSWSSDKPLLANQWEQDQLKRAQQIVTANPDEILVVGGKDYEYVFDESQFVDFSEDEELAGDGVDPDSDPHATADSKSAHSLRAVRESLPVFQVREQFLELAASNQVIVVVGETGSGKTTQLPQYLYEAGYTAPSADGKPRKIGCTQPRRVAATSVAARVAEEVGCRIGTTVGYSVRFDDKSSAETEIKYVTDGMLLREFLTDPLLSSYSALMIDEAHERTVSTEIVLTLLKDLLEDRQDLKVIVASATINADKFSSYFNDAPIFKIAGRRFPVDICYTKHPEANYLQAAITTVFQIHTKTEMPGDILVFLTGQDEIETMEEALLDATRQLGLSIPKLLVAPIYANLPPQHQKKIFDPTPPHTRKVVLATNIAETSITIDGIMYVVDPGYVKENIYNPGTGMESLVVSPCLRASADQRAGRAGRVGPGKCYRLYTKWSFYNELEASPKPEILRVNLSSVILLLLLMGVTDLLHFDFMDPPSHQTLIQLLELLYALGALNAKGQLTQTGRKMAEFPLAPMYGRCILASGEFGVVEEVLSVLAMVSESSNLFYRPKALKEQADRRRQALQAADGDHVTLLQIWHQWADSGFSNIWCEDNFLQYRTLKRIKDVRLQLLRLCEKVGVENKSQKSDLLPRVKRALLAGFFPNVARVSKLGTSYVQLKKRQPVYIHPSSGLARVKPPPKFVMYHELVLTTKEYMRNCTVVDERWVDEVAGHYYKKADRDGT